MIGAFFVNNFTEILSMTFIAWLGYGFGRFIQKRWPTLHLRPWKWRIKRDS